MISALIRVLSRIAGTNIGRNTPQERSDTAAQNFIASWSSLWFSSTPYDLLIKLLHRSHTTDTYARIIAADFPAQ